MEGGYDQFNDDTFGLADNLDADGGEFMFGKALPREEDIRNGLLPAVSSKEEDPWAAGPGATDNLPSFFGGESTASDQQNKINRTSSINESENSTKFLPGMMSLKDLENSLAGGLALDVLSDVPEKQQQTQHLPQTQQRMNIPPQFAQHIAAGWRPGMPLPRGFPTITPMSMTGNQIPRGVPPEMMMGGFPQMIPNNNRGLPLVPPRGQNLVRNPAIVPPVSSRPPPPKRMRWRDVDFVVRQQMKALRNLSYDDDYYFHALCEKRNAAAGLNNLSRFSGARGTGQIRPSLWAEKTEERCKAWADTKKTLGYTAKTNLRAPRQLINLSSIKSSSSAKTDEVENIVDPDEAVGTKDIHESYRALQQPKWRALASIESGISACLKLEAEVRRMQAYVQDREGNRNNRSSKTSKQKMKILRSDLADVWCLQWKPNKNRSTLVSEREEEWKGLKLLKTLKGKKLLVRTLQPDILNRQQRNALLAMSAQYLVHFVYSTGVDDRDAEESEKLNEKVTQTLVDTFALPSVSLSCLTKCLSLLTQSQTLEMIPYLLQFKASADVVRVLLVQGEAAADASNSSSLYNEEAEDSEDDSSVDKSRKNPNWRERNGSDLADSKTSKDNNQSADKSQNPDERAVARARTVQEWHTALDSLKAKIAAGTAAAGAE